MFNRRTFRKHRKPRVRVHTKTGKTFEGVLLEVYGDHYHLSAARFLKSPEETHSIDGPVAIPAENVEAVEVVIAREAP